MGKTELRCFARLVLPYKLLVLTLNAISNILLFVTLYLDSMHGPSVQLLPKVTVRVRSKFRVRVRARTRVRVRARDRVNR